MREKWEYSTLKDHKGKSLNEIGLEGWEMCGSRLDDPGDKTAPMCEFHTGPRSTLFFKRRIYPKTTGDMMI